MTDKIIYTVLTTTTTADRRTTAVTVLTITVTTLSPSYKLGNSMGSAERNEHRRHIVVNTCNLDQRLSALCLLPCCRETLVVAGHVTSQNLGGKKSVGVEGVVESFHCAETIIVQSCSSS